MKGGLKHQPLQLPFRHNKYFGSIKLLASFYKTRKGKKTREWRAQWKSRLIRACNGAVITLCNDMLLCLWFLCWPWPPCMMDHNGELIVPLLTDTRTCLTPIPSGHSRPPEPGPLRHSTGNSAVQQIPQSSPRASFVGRFPFSFSLPNVSSSYKRCLSLSSESLCIWPLDCQSKLQSVSLTACNYYK